MIKLKYILLGIIIVLLDIAVYIVLGVLLMSYDDTYNESNGVYWSLSSMSFSEKVSYIAINIWHLINLIAIGYLIYRIIKRIKKNAAARF